MLDLWVCMQCMCDTFYLRCIKVRLEAFAKFETTYQTDIAEGRFGTETNFFLVYMPCHS